jgi:solute carrier family 35 protein F5
MPILGDFLALASALFYALYVILLKVRIRSESRIDMRLFFGFVGLFNILTCWPLGVFLHLVGVEPFELPTTKRALGAILISVGASMSLFTEAYTYIQILITATSDYLYVLAMLKTTPLVVTIGLSLTIPLAVLGDLILGKYTAVQVIVGAFLVLVSFIAVGMDDVNNGSSKREGSRTQVVAGDRWETQSRESLQDEAVLT